jgi:hypothetical protein
MCRRATCANCEKPTWVGCGAHVDQVLADVAVEDRCSCPPGEKRVDSWFRRLLNR